MVHSTVLLQQEETFFISKLYESHILYGIITKIITAHILVLILAWTAYIEALYFHVCPLDGHAQFSIKLVLSQFVVLPSTLTRY